MNLISRVIFTSSSSFDLFQKGEKSNRYRSRMNVKSNERIRPVGRSVNENRQAASHLFSDRVTTFAICTYYHLLHMHKVVYRKKLCNCIIYFLVIIVSESDHISWDWSKTSLRGDLFSTCGTLFSLLFCPFFFPPNNDKSHLGFDKRKNRRFDVRRNSSKNR